MAKSKQSAMSKRTSKGAMEVANTIARKVAEAVVSKTKKKATEV